MSKTNPLQSYRETQIRTANGGKLIVMLYDAAIKSINAALDCLNRDAKQLDTISNHIIKAQDIVTELMVSLDFERGGRIAKSLFSLYEFVNRQLLDANLNKHASPLESVNKLLCELREAWYQVEGTKIVDDEDSKVGGVNIAG